MSPYFSPKRKAWLLSVEEVMQVFGISKSTAQRLLKKTDGYSEIVSMKRAAVRGSTRTLYVDPYTLGLPLPAELVNKFSESVQKVTESSESHSPAKPTGTLNNPDSLDSGEKFRGSLELALRTKFRGSTETESLPLSPPHYLETPQLDFGH